MDHIAGQLLNLAKIKLVEIKSVTKTEEKEVSVPDVDAQGNPIIDNNLPKTHKEKKTIVLPPQLVAVLEDVATGKHEEFPKLPDFKKRAEYLEHLKALADKAAADAKKNPPKPKPKTPPKPKPPPPPPQAPIAPSNSGSSGGHHGYGSN